MKRILALILSLTLVMALFTACGTSKETSKDATDTPATTTPAETTTPDTTTPDTTAPAETAKAAKTGLAVITSVGKSKDATAEADGTGQVDSVAVALLIGQDGKILDCKIDTAQTKIAFSATGVLTTPADTVFQSKQELGAGYGMVKNSKIGKEWFEQANAFTAYVAGKTVEEVNGIALTEETKPADAELAASVTMKVAPYISVITKAAANAK